jgi:hypothetical protein
MRRLFGLLVLTAGLSSAGTIDSASRNLFDDNIFDDPLHGYCAPPATQCIDLGSNSPTSINPPSNFGFTVNTGPLTGTLLLDFLEPNNQANAPVTVTGTFSGTATLFSGTAWTSGNLATFLGITASDDNPIGNYIPDSAAPGATGLFVYQLSVPSVTLQGVANPNVSPLENISGGLPQGTYIVGFLNTGTPPFIATANSGAILETAAPVPEPRTSVAMIVGSLLMALVFRKKGDH